MYICVCVCIYILSIQHMYIERFVTWHFLMWLWSPAKQAQNVYGNQSRECNGQTQTHWHVLELLPVSSQERSIVKRMELHRHSQKLFSTGGISFFSLKNMVLSFPVFILGCVCTCAHTYHKTYFIELPVWWTPRKSVLHPSIHPCFPPCPTSSSHWCFCCLHSFTFSRMSYGWNHVVL